MLGLQNKGLKCFYEWTFLNRYNHIVVLFCCLIWIQSEGQELEPRSINNLPVGSNFLIGGYGFARGNILLDPALPVEGVDSDIHTMVAGYVRSIKFLGMSSKIDFILPYVTGDYRGSIEEDINTANRTGFGDIRVRFSFNFVGSDAMDVKQFLNYSPDVVSGISIQVIAPTGSYDNEALLNPGSNRWVIKPQWGIAKNYEKWSLEGYVGLWIFGENDDYLSGNSLKQEPLLTFKAHGIRALKNNSWLSISAGYGIGGRTEINGRPRETQISTMRLAVLYALPIAKQSTLKFTALTGIRFERGSDYNGIALSYQYRWLQKKEKLKLQ